MNVQVYMGQQEPLYIDPYLSKINLVCIVLVIYDDNFYIYLAILEE